MDDERRLTSAWEMMHKDNDGEAHVTELHRYEYNRKLPEGYIPPQAEHVNFRVTRRKLAQRAFTSMFIFGDAQIGYRQIDNILQPIHDEQAMAVARAIARDEQPNIITNLSDHVDFPTFSTYDADSNHFDSTTQASINRGHSYWAELKADNPQAELHEVDSNHTVRPTKMLARKVMEFYGLRQAGTNPSGPMLLSYSHLLNHDALGVNFHSGRNQVYNYKPDFQLRHGNELRSGGSTAEMLSKKYPYFNQVVGHGHTIEQHNRTTPDGKYYTTIQNGCLCMTTGEVPSAYSSVDDQGFVVPHQENWQQSVTIMRDHLPENPSRGDYEMIIIPIRNGKAYFNGKEYVANKESDE